MLETDQAVTTDQGIVEMTDDVVARDLRDTRPFTGPPAEAERLPLDTILPNKRNPRGEDGLDVESLAASIHEYGLMQPILVRGVSNPGEEERYEIISGHRRRLAFLLLRQQHPHEARWRTIPAVIRTTDSARAYLMLLSSQLHSMNFTPDQEASAIERLVAEGMEQQEIARVLHKSEGYISKHRRIFDDPVLGSIVQLPEGHPHRLSMGIAEEIVSVPDVDKRRELATQAAEEGWSQKEVRTAVRTQGVGKTVLAAIRLVRELRPLLREIHPEDLAQTHIRELDELRREIIALAQRPKRGTKREVVFPSLETAQEHAGVGARALRKAEERARKGPRTRFRTG